MYSFFFVVAEKEISLSWLVKAARHVEPRMLIDQLPRAPADSTKNFKDYLLSLRKIPKEDPGISELHRRIFHLSLSNPPEKLASMLLKTSTFGEDTQMPLDLEYEETGSERFRKVINSISDMIHLEPLFSEKGSFLNPQGYVSTFNDECVLPWLLLKEKTHKIVKGFGGENSLENAIDGEINSSRSPAVSLFHIDVKNFNQSIRTVDLFNFYYNLLEGNKLLKDDRMDVAGYLTATSGKPLDDNIRFYLSTGNKLGRNLQNRILKKLDHEIFELAEEREYGIIRYIDNYIFSSTKEAIDPQFMEEVVMFLSHYFPVNFGRLSYQKRMTKNQPLFVLNYSLNSGGGDNNKVGSLLVSQKIKNFIINDLEFPSNEPFPKGEEENDIPF